MKSRFPSEASGCGDVPSEFVDFLEDSRSLQFGQMPDYDAIKNSFSKLIQRAGYSLRGPLDWRPHKRRCTIQLEEPDLSGYNEEDLQDKMYDGELNDSDGSYFGMDIDCWDVRQSEREKDLTLPEELKAKLGLDFFLVPTITRVDRVRNLTSIV
jgi:hypothetical protein